ncbi:hypothetical protein BDV96DRAFT_654080 [Lophiotrema nucula]|uniref:Rhodopsin domain-containing protein n=1 Tax=Lophiotrema nucula TaxID=690887 RepID=A0A6A5YKX4_9PLEO|nr:hypothetical protein BDV96DRAFT_654080 [Lophiotrema nucula]
MTMSAVHKVTSEAILLAAATIAVALRFWARKKLKMGWKADDWFALTAWFLLTVYISTLFYSFNHDIDVSNLEMMTISEIITILKLTYFSIYMMSVVITLARLSIIFLYYRIFGVYDNFRRALWVMGGLTIAWVVMIIFLNTFRCKPVALAYNPLLKGKCLNMTTLFFATESINCALDLALVLLPLWRIPFLHLSLRDRIGLCLVFLTGSFVCITSILRIVFTYNMDTVQSAFWLTLQLSFAVICSCLPTLRTYLPKHIPKPSTITSYFRSSVFRKTGDPSSHLEKASQYSNSDKTTSSPPSLRTYGFTQTEDGKWTSSAV